MAAQMLRARGARVVLCGRRRVRLDLALRHSADAVVDTREQNVRTELRTHAPDGVDMVVDAGSAPDTALYLDILRERDGQIVLSGFSTDGLMRTWTRSRNVKSRSIQTPGGHGAVWRQRLIWWPRGCCRRHR